MELVPEDVSLYIRKVSSFQRVFCTLAILQYHVHVHVSIFTDSAVAISNDLIAAGLLEMKDMVVGNVRLIPMFSYLMLLCLHDTYPHSSCCKHSKVS